MPHPLYGLLHSRQPYGMYHTLAWESYDYGISPKDVPSLGYISPSPATCEMRP